MQKRAYNRTKYNLNSLPVGTKFHVINGDWDGEITEKNGKKCMKHQFGETVLTKDAELRIKIIK